MRVQSLALLGFSLVAPLVAQTPGAKFTEGFFKGDRKAILQACADEARAIKPKDAKWLAEYGRAYLAALDRPKAEAAFKEALAKEPKDGEVHRLIGVAWLKHGFKQQALEAYGLILSLDAKNKDALVAAALDLAEVGLVNDAEKFISAFAAMEKDDWKTFVQFGRAFLQSGNRDQAAKWFSRAVTCKPKEEKVYLEISRAFADSQAVL
ncbi:MAG TPA: tetratricopeptide repeat protein [Holophagaceae bacterium]|nr:tetratricopeptide repeat protein [Holophagaceae bacterium]